MSANYIENGNRGGRYGRCSIGKQGAGSCAGVNLHLLVYQALLNHIICTKDESACCIAHSTRLLEAKFLHNCLGQAFDFV